ncbi:MAG: hypothetical protein ACJ8FY_28290 [Gemmataceae bacterium]
MATLPDPPNNLRLVLGSFRVVANTEEPRPYIAPLAFPGGPTNLGSGCNSAAGALVLLAFCVAVVVVAETAVISYEAGTLAVHDLRHAYDRPKELREAYDRGLTCDIHATASLEWPDGRRREIDLRGLVHGSETLADREWQSEIRTSVQGACTQMALECKNRVLHPEAVASSVNKPKAPAFTAYGGK